MRQLRFANPELQARFLEGLAALPFAVQRSADGSVICSEEEWDEVNTVAHRVRDGCFKWYFSLCHRPADVEELGEHLRSNGLRHEIEYHEDGLVIFLLPQADRDKHIPSSDFPPPTPDTCSFCGSSYAERQFFYTKDIAAICDECIREFHAGSESSELGSRKD